MNNNFVGKVVTLDNNKKLYVLDQLIMDNKVYLSTLELIDDNTPSNVSVIVNVSLLNDDIIFTEVDDIEICTQIYDKLAEQVSE